MKSTCHHKETPPRETDPTSTVYIPALTFAAWLKAILDLSNVFDLAFLSLV